MTRSCGGERQVTALCPQLFINQANLFRVTHKIYGVPQTINTANYVYFLAYQELLALCGDDASPSQADLISIITCAVYPLFCAEMC